MLNFRGNLDEAQVRHALRYITWEFNGFPSWLEQCIRHTRNWSKRL